MRVEDAPEWRERQEPQADRVPYDAVRRWYLKDGSFISSALQAEAAWVALNERLLWQRLREKSL